MCSLLAGNWPDAGSLTFFPKAGRESLYVTSHTTPHGVPRTSCWTLTIPPQICFYVSSPWVKVIQPGSIDHRQPAFIHTRCFLPFSTKMGKVIGSVSASFKKMGKCNRKQCGEYVDTDSVCIVTFLLQLNYKIKTLLRCSQRIQFTH